MKKVIEVSDIPSFEFWVNMFKPRTLKYKRETLARLKKGVSPFETPEENTLKIQALKFLLNI